MSQTINVQILKDFVEFHGISPAFQKFFRQICIQNRYKYLEMTSNTLIEIAEKINHQITVKRKRKQQRKSNFWKKGEFKLFVWFAAFYAFKIQLSIIAINSQDFEFFSTIFLKRCPQRMQYQFKSLFRVQKNARQKWQPREVQLLKDIVSAYEKNNKNPEWKAISYNMYLRSGGTSFRTFGQCRQMWNNHLSQSLKKEKWSEQEDQLLLKLVSQNKKQWSKIAEKFEGKRSCHMVKNRYFQLIKYEQNQEQQKKSDLFQCLQPFSIEKEGQQNLEFWSQSYLLTLCQPTKSLFIQQKKKALKELKQQVILDKYVSKSVCQDQGDFLESNKFISELTCEKAVKAQYCIQRDIIELLGCQHYEQLPYQFEQQWNYSPKGQYFDDSCL